MDSRFSSQTSSQHYSHQYPPSTRQPVAPSYPASQRLPPTSVPPSHTLPPLSSHSSAYTFSHDPLSQKGQTSQPLYFSGNSSLSNQNGSYPVYPSNANTQYQPQAYPPPIRPLQTPSNYTSQSWGSQTSTPQAYQSYHPPNGSQGLPNLLPMPNTQMNQPNALFQQPPQTSTSSEYDPHQHQRQPQPQQQSQSQLTHVVGSQGRRGILPSASGRPSAMVNGSSTSQKATTPAKDAEGKFPCEHCNKNYLHAKHLKRHLLRRML